MTKQIELIEVGPRDGLQNEPSLITSEDKVTLVNLLSEAGFSTIEVTSFVSPKWVPQLADAHQVMTQINRKKAIRYIVLTPNQRGYDGAIAADADEIAILRLQPKPSARKILTAVLKKVWHALSLCWHRHVRVTCLSEVIFPVWWAVLMRVMLPMRQSNMLQTGCWRADAMKYRLAIR